MGGSELITVHIGRAGHAIGACFWDQCVREYEASQEGNYADSFTPHEGFFRRVGANMHARAVVLDSEASFSSMQSATGSADLFDLSHFVDSYTGTADNFALVSENLFPQIRNDFMRNLRLTMEEADSPSGFLILGGIAGGLGSGGLAAVTDILAEMYPQVFRTVAPIWPSERSDIVVSPYNATLALAGIQENATLVLPIDNDALTGVRSVFGNDGSISASNRIAADALLTMTGNMRFTGELRVASFREIATNLCPFPAAKYVVCASPYDAYTGGSGSGGESDSLSSIFSDVVNPKQNMMGVDLTKGTIMAAGFLARGATLNEGEISTRIKALEKSRGVSFGFGVKVGVCNVPPLNRDISLSVLANSTAMNKRLKSLHKRFDAMFTRRAHVHHYTEQGMEESQLSEAAESLSSIISEYDGMEGMGL